MKNKKRLPIIFLTAAIMIIAAAVPASAASPKKESIEYKGKGKVEVEFIGKVYYKKPYVTVKDTSGKKYSASIVDRDSDDLDFRIKNYKEGKTYKFTIKGVKKRGTSKYGSLSGTVKIPSAKKAAADIGSTKAKKIALSKVPGATERHIVSFERDREHGRIEYEGEIYYKGVEYEFEIRGSDGRILSWEVDRD